MSNPVLSEKMAEKFLNYDESYEKMTISGTVLKTSFLFSILLLTSIYTYFLTIKGMTDKAGIFSSIGLIGGLITASILIFSRNKALYAPLSMLYAGLEGLCIGSITSMFTALFGNSIALNAVLLVFCAMFSVLFLYSTRIIKCTQKFMATLTASMLAILIIYSINIIALFINPSYASIFDGNSAFGIGFSIIVCIIGALSYISDFHTIEQAKKMGVSKDFEWYGAFSIMVTTIWVYIEILRLLAKANSRR